MSITGVPSPRASPSPRITGSRVARPARTAGASHAYGNAKTVDEWHAMSEVSGRAGFGGGAAAAFCPGCRKSTSSTSGVARLR